MNTIRKLLFSLLMGLSPLSLQATHDNGLGKSQDGNDYDALASTAVAPEPETYLLFLIGLAVLGAWFRLSGRALRT